VQLAPKEFQALLLFKAELAQLVCKVFLDL
jgi:hypothetical protein